MPERAFTVETIELDLPAVTTAFGRRLHEEGVPVTAERTAAFARSLTLVAPISRRRLYWTARAVLVSDQSQVKPFDSVFFAVFGSPGAVERRPDLEDLQSEPTGAVDRPRSERHTAPVGASAGRVCTSRA